jgi:uncharacterized protein (TIGR00645 family)
MLGVLDLIDVVMIANLLIMVIIGGYETSFPRIRIRGHPDQPSMSHVNTNVLKVKLTDGDHRSPPSTCSKPSSG